MNLSQPEKDVKMDINFTGGKCHKFLNVMLNLLSALEVATALLH